MAPQQGRIEIWAIKRENPKTIYLSFKLPLIIDRDSMTMLPGILMLLRFSIRLLPSMFLSIQKTRYILAIIPRVIFKLGRREVLLLHDPFKVALLPLSLPMKMSLFGMRMKESIGGK